MSKKVTIQDIADALGVSRNTVSKAINNSEGLAEVTREKILQKAVEMGYKQFSYVQALTNVAQMNAKEKQQKEEKGEIALLTTFASWGSHFITTMLDRLQRELHQLGYRLNTHQVTKEDLRKKMLPFTFVPENCAAILCVEMFDYDYDCMLCDLGIPVLFVDAPTSKNGRRLPADKLMMDNLNPICRILSRALEEGLTEFGFIGDYDHCQSFFERFNAFCGTLFYHHMAIHQEYIIKSNDVLEIYQQINAMEKLPDMFFCANDFLAHDTLMVLRKLGKSVPEDVMLVGFDDSQESRLSMPSLTTVHIHTQIMAYCAAQLLISRVETPSLDYRSVYTETYPIYRETTVFHQSEEEEA